MDRPVAAKAANDLKEGYNGDADASSLVKVPEIVNTAPNVKPRGVN